MTTLLVSDEAHVQVSGYAIKQNFRFWAPNNPHELHQCPLHSTKLTVCCEVYSHFIIGPYFFENEKRRTVTVNAERYKLILEKFLSIELHPRQQICCGYNKMEQLLTQQKFPCKSSGQYFLAETFLVKGQHLARPLV